MITKTRSSALSYLGGSIIGTWVSPSDISGVLMGGESIGPDSQGVASFNETISYERPRFKSYGNCIHSRDELHLWPSGYVRTTSRYSQVNQRVETYRIDRTDWYLPTKYRSFIAGVPTPTARSAKWSQWSSEALDALLPTFAQGGESMVNAVLELKQLKQLFTTWKPLFMRLKREVRRRLNPDIAPRRKPRKKRPFNVKATIKELSGYHLNIAFGWLPFVSDVSRVYTALEDFQQKVRRLQEQSGKPIKAHFKRHVDTVDLPAETAQTDENGVRRRKTLWATPPVYNATVDYIFVLPDMSSLVNQAKAFADSLGVQADPSIIWNALPYSFVIDWFLDVGGWLHGLRTDNLRIPATVTGFCHSLKYEWETTYTFTTTGAQNNLLFPFKGEENLLATRRGLRYERRRDIPSYGLLNTTVKVPSWNKVALATSLLAQRL